MEKAKISIRVHLLKKKLNDVIDDKIDTLQAAARFYRQAGNEAEALKYDFAADALHDIRADLRKIVRTIPERLE